MSTASEWRKPLHHLKEVLKRETQKFLAVWATRRHAIQKLDEKSDEKNFVDKGHGITQITQMTII